ncbi:MAG: RluA family pseudouridine synthase [Clostridia bacterium]|nr:RluA family pseudouridine synthase [Clostridia bacterium]
MDVIYKDSDIAVIVKPVGLISEDGAEGESIIPVIKKELLAKEVYPIHRLDRNVGGTMVYALNKKSAAVLSAAVQCDGVEKTYLAVVHGRPSEENGVFEDLLFKDSRKNKSFVVTRERKGVKRASLEYSVLGTKEEKTLVRILLHTGRSHQIRVQFSSRRMPLVGDGKYGAPSNEKEIYLFSHKLEFEHPKSKEKMEFSALPLWDSWKEFF